MLAGLAAAGLGYVLGFFSGDRGGRNSPSKSAPPDHATPTYNWRMLTSWPAGAPGTGATAERLAERIQVLSQGRIKITVHAAGELVGALEVFDAVSRGTAELGHTASFFWQGKSPLTAFFTAVPFGLTPDHHHSWLYQGGGQELWDELYRSFNLKPFTAGNTGPSMGGWFKKPLDFSNPKPFSGLKFRMPGLGGKLVKEFGAVPLVLPPGEVFSALQSGAIDAAELLAPWHDRAFGLHKAAKHCYYPGFHEPNGSAECLVNLASYESLPSDLQQLIREACATENIIGLAESDWHNSRALAELRNEGVTFTAYPREFLQRMRRAARPMVEDAASGSALGRRLYASYQKAQELSASWKSTKL